MGEEFSKFKLAVPLEEFEFIKDTSEGYDIYNLLGHARNIKLTDSMKKDFLVVKSSYVLLDSTKKKVVVITRNPKKHTNKVSNFSVLLSSGIEKFYGFAKEGQHGHYILNSYHPFTQKLGAYSNDFELPSIKINSFPFPIRFSAFAYREDHERHYLFLIHYATLHIHSHFPDIDFPLEYPNEVDPENCDKIKGFFPLDKVSDKLKNDPDLKIDRFALNMIRRKVDPNDANDSSFRGFYIKPLKTKFTQVYEFADLAPDISISPFPPFVSLNINFQKINCIFRIFSRNTNN